MKSVKKSTERIHVSLKWEIRVRSLVTLSIGVGFLHHAMGWKKKNEKNIRSEYEKLIDSKFLLFFIFVFLKILKLRNLI